MLRTASSLPLTGLLTLGSDPARFPTRPPACYRASWQLPGPDFHRQATTSLRTARSAATSQRHLPLCWAHEKPGLGGRLFGLSATCGRGRHIISAAVYAATLWADRAWLHAFSASGGGNLSTRSGRWPG